MKTLAPAVLAVLLALSACAEAPPSEEVTAQMVAQRQQTARQLRDDAARAVESGGASAAAPYVAGLEEALAQAPQADDGLDSPYAAIALLLARYYNDSGRPDDALRVVEGRGEDSAVLVERAVALGKGQHWPQALAAWEKALRQPELDTATRVRLLCGRGGALVDLGRPNEAELSLRAALALDPGNALAERELIRAAAVRGGTAARAFMAR